ncbi:MAG: hypothetical protein NTW87_25925, partial [Planctomycetota bacterium]|nr:hypothetical protein [Planctomycetota bacterium]
MRSILIAGVLTAAAFAAGGAAAGEPPAWRTLRVPGFWEDQDKTLAKYDGFAWYRCFVKVPDSFKGQAAKLELGGIDDCDEAFVNGKKVGATGSMPPNYVGLSGPQRKYP